MASGDREKFSGHLESDAKNPPDAPRPRETFRCGPGVLFRASRRWRHTQARSHGQGEGAARAHGRRAIENRRRAAPGRNEARGSVVGRSTSTGRNLPAAPEPPDVAVVGGREAAAISTISPRARRDARPEARRRPRGVLLQAAPRRAVPRVHPRDGRRVAGVQKGGARAAAPPQADVLPRPGLSRSSCDY